MKNSTSAPNNTYDINQYRLAKKRKQMMNHILLGILVVLVIGLVYCIAEGIVQRAESKRETTAHFPVSMTGENPIDVQTTNSELFIVGERKLLAYAPSATKTIDLVHDMGKPVSIIQGDRVLTYDSGGYSWQISQGNEVLYSDNSDYQIVLGRMKEDGHFALVTFADRFYGCLTVYSKDNQQIYKYSDSQNYITDFQFISRSKGLLISQTVSGIGMDTVLTGLDFTDEENTKLFTTTLKDTLVYAAQVQKNGTAILLTNRGISLMAEDGSVTQTESFSNSYRALSLDGAKPVIALAQLADINQTVLYQVESDGTLGDSVTLDFVVQDLYCDKSGAVCLGHNQIVEMDGGLRVTGSYKNDVSYNHVVRLRGKLYGASKELLGVVGEASDEEVVVESANEAQTVLESAADVPENSALESEEAAS